MKDDRTLAWLAMILGVAGHVIAIGGTLVFIGEQPSSPFRGTESITARSMLICCTGVAIGFVGGLLAALSLIILNQWRRFELFAVFVCLTPFFSSFLALQIVFDLCGLVSVDA